MSAKQMGLAWIPVQDFKKAIKFYTEVVGLKLVESNEEWGWAELEGKDGGIRLGIGQYREEESPVKPGHNAVLTFTVQNVDAASKEMEKKGATLVGEVCEVPGHVRMQMIKDSEGNFIHIVEHLPASEPAGHSHHHKHEKGGCCGGH
jgi:predicted enzyme related to lactoylglutathione lyase